VFGIGLIPRDNGCRFAGGSNVVLPPIDDDFPDDGPLEDDPDWEVPPDDPNPPDPGDLYVPPAGNVVAQERLIENGVAYRNENAGPKNRKAKVTLQEVTQSQGYVAPLLIDSQNYIGTTYDVGTGKLKAVKKVAGVETQLGEVTADVDAGDQIGGLVSGGKYWITHNDIAVAGSFDVPEILEQQRSGLIAKGPATDAWISRYQLEGVGSGYGQGYGLGYGETV
jgi:hypothetical protein